MSYDIVQKPSFYNDLFAIPRNTQRRVSSAVRRIQSDPIRGEGNSRRCLKHLYSNLYRFRIGDYRLLYSVGDRCISLLAIGHRNDVYDRFHATEEDLSPGPVNTASAGLHIIPTTSYDTMTSAHTVREQPKSYAADAHVAEPNIAGSHVADSPVAKPLVAEFHVPESKTADEDTGTEGDEGPLEKTPRLLSQLLNIWNVDTQYHETILSCRSVEDLLGIDVPDDVKEKLLHWHEPPTIDKILEQPTMALDEPEDLDRYMEGSLKHFLLKLDPEQERLASRTLKGPTLVKGGPGTGKSVVALYRLKNLLETLEQHQLFSVDRPRVLFVTYTRALINVSEQLLTELLGARERANLDIMTLDSTAKSLIDKAGDPFRPASQRDEKAALEQVLAQFEVPDELSQRAGLRNELLGLRPEYMLEEFNWVIEGRGLETQQQYLDEDRTGRGIRFDRTMRAAVWALHEQYLSALRRRGQDTWNSYRNRAAQLARELDDATRYDVVVIDEAQDLTPVALRLCIELCKHPKGLYLTADASQSIYSRGFSWQRVHDDLQLRGRTTILRRNYRMTQQIGAVAVQLLEDHGGGDAEALENQAVHWGPKPILRGCRNANEELRAIAEFLRDSAHSLAMPVGSGAVLVRTNGAAKQVAEGLTALGVPAKYMMSGQVTLDTNEVRVMTVHAAKGLEFPFVAVARVNRGLFPIVPRSMQAEEREEQIVNERRLLFVALSRAMRRLMVTYTRPKASPFVDEFDEELWAASI